MKYLNILNFIIIFMMIIIIILRINISLTILKNVQTLILALKIVVKQCQYKKSETFQSMNFKMILYVLRTMLTKVIIAIIHFMFV